ncbi:MAG: hypothetical protein IPN20_04900 [Haliscomenobacter sp.]|nr:hypothetical protein [Haliscomenobacter sp.]
MTHILEKVNVAPTLLRTVKDKKIDLKYDWKPNVAEFGNEGSVVWFHAPKDSLVISVQLKKDLEGASNPEITLDGSLSGFFVQLFQIIRLEFNKIGFTPSRARNSTSFAILKGSRSWDRWNSSTCCRK